ncbi:Na+/H+ antiporter NhaA [Myxococcus stipitatus]|uniref:Na+/H+ antiporter NhaA n=1 Tax=Myxococcus stipitatus TaxID=83455 RepID=UPI001F312C52|nr:Na+/H+ antiporter NhaA [Myxococcus stipitatus]MCE9668629.1 Na+/H+ antiporter NhaA [Myxococcus stipitatus]
MSSTPPLNSPSLPSSPPEAWEPLLRIARLATRPLERFLRIEAASGILLLVSAAVALAWANSPWAESYTHLWHTPVGVRVGSFTFERSLEWLVNDGLMVIFFFVVGMEIRRELHHGELSEWRRAALPAAAALGGMLAPAALYLLFAGAPETRSGWGVPMATDIAFALGILTLLGKRVPPALRVLLLALAVIDDLGAIVVIALFYSSGVALQGLLVAMLGLGGVFVMQRLGVRAKLAYVAPALVAWGGIYAAGIHPTIAGVLVGLMTPVRAWLGSDGFLEGVRQELEQLTRAPAGARSPHELAETLRHVDLARREALSPSESLIETLHPWVAFGIMPLFALANAGVAIGGSNLGASSWGVAGAVAVGLVVGKPLGVLLAIWLTLRLRIGTLPAGLTARHLVVLGVVAGVGFTMALFVAQLAFTDAGLLAAAKLGVLAASGGAAVLGLVLGWWLLREPSLGTIARSADEAEGSTTL